MPPSPSHTQGLQLRRSGKLTLLIIAADDQRVWVVDVSALGAAAFNTPRCALPTLFEP